MSALGITYAFSNTEESQRTASLVDSDTSIAAANLVSGKKYLILANASPGADGAASPTNARKSEATVDYGGTEWSKVQARAANTIGSTPASMDGPQISTAFILTGDGSNDLKIKYRQVEAGDPGYPAYISGKGLIAIPLESLVEGVDYWYDQNNSPSDSAEATFTTGNDNVLRSATFTINETGNYLVFAGFEVNQVVSGDIMRGRLEVNGTTFRYEPRRRRYLNTDWTPMSWAGTRRISAGSCTVRLLGDAVSGTNTRSIRRSRIILVRCNTFATIVNNLRIDPQLITDAYPSWNDMVIRTYPHSVDEDIIMIASGLHTDAGAGGETGVRIYDADNAEAFASIVSYEDTNGADKSSHVAFGAKPVTADTQFKFQATKRFTGPNQEETELILWGMTLSEDYETAESRVEIAPGVDVTTEWTSTGASHYTEIDDELGGADAFDDYIQTGAAGNTDEFTPASFSNRLRMTQRVEIGFDYSGLNTGVQPGTRITLENPSGDVLYQKSFDMGGVGTEKTGYGGALPLMMTKDELSGLIIRLESIDGSAADPPIPVET